MSKRAAYIRENYSLKAEDEFWVARWPGGSITGVERDRVVRQFRCLAGHFNFEDEAEAFAEVLRASCVGR